MIIANHNLNALNYKDAASELSMPYTVLRRLLGIRPPLQITTDQVAFFKVLQEEPFLGEANGNRFIDPGAMCAFMASYRVHAGFNCMKKDNLILSRLAPRYWVDNQYLSSDTFKVKKMNGFMLDLLVPFMLCATNTRHNLKSLQRYTGMKDLALPTSAMSAFWKQARSIFNYMESRFYIDPESVSATDTRLREDRETGKSAFGLPRLRRICLQSWMLQHGVWPAPMDEEKTEKPGYYTRCVPGIHYGVESYDVRSAYPTTAINLNLKLWGEIQEQGDFAAYQTFLRQERAAHPEISQFLKMLANASIGDLSFAGSAVRNPDLMSRIWNAFHERMQEWAGEIGEGRIIYSYTDCVVGPFEEVPPLPGYEVAHKASLKWLAIYNINRTIARKDDRIILKHFDKPLKLPMFAAADQAIKGMLLREGPEILLQPISLPPDFLKSLPPEATQQTIIKDGPCHDPKYFKLWFSLRPGPNNVQIAPAEAKKLLSSYLKLYLLKPGVETHGQD